MNIKFVPLNEAGTSLRGYLHAPQMLELLKKIYPERSFNDKSFPYYNFDTNLKLLDLSFEEVVARLYNLSNQNIFEQGDGYKLSFQVVGTYKDVPFTLYDYKGEFDIHIGGTNELDIDNFRKELDELVMKTTPKSYTARVNYDGNTSEYHFTQIN